MKSSHVIILMKTTFSSSSIKKIVASIRIIILPVFQKLIYRAEKLFVSIYYTLKYFTMFYIHSLALHEQKQREQNIPT